MDPTPGCGCWVGNTRGSFALAPYHDLADAYASADVCLNIHSIQCPTCLNPRDFDVLMATGCLLSDCGGYGFGAIAGWGGLDRLCGC